MDAKNLKCTLSDDELLNACQQWIDRLCDTGGRAWSLSVPVNFNRDPDVIFWELINRYRKIQSISPPKSVPMKETNPFPYKDGGTTYLARNEDC